MYTRYTITNPYTIYKNLDFSNQIQYFVFEMQKTLINFLKYKFWCSPAKREFLLEQSEISLFFSLIHIENKTLNYK